MVRVKVEGILGLKNIVYKLGFAPLVHHDRVGVAGCTIASDGEGEAHGQPGAICRNLGGFHQKRSEKWSVLHPRRSIG